MYSSEEIKYWMSYLLLLIFNTIFFFLGIMGAFDRVYVLNNRVFGPFVTYVRSELKDIVFKFESFTELSGLKQKNLTLSMQSLKLQEEILELQEQLKECGDFKKQNSLTKNVVQGKVVNRFFNPTGYILVDFGEYAYKAKDLKDSLVFFRRFYVGRVVEHKKNLLTVKTIWTPGFKQQIFLEKAKISAIFIRENDRFYVDDVLTKENVLKGDLVYISGNLCVNKIYIGKVVRVLHTLGSAKKRLELEPFVQINNLDYVYICKK